MNQLFRLPKAKHAGSWIAVLLLSGAFALKALGLIDATSLWSESSTPWARAFSLITAPLWRCFGRTPIRFSTTRFCGFGVQQLGKAP